MQTYCIIATVIFVLQDFVYPNNVAYPIGGPDSHRFMVMQVHYDNPMMNSGNQFMNTLTVFSPVYLTKCLDLKAFGKKLCVIF